jgi:small subunit ribosomal protein S1
MRHSGGSASDDNLPTSSTEVERHPMLEWLDSGDSVVQVQRGDILQGVISSVSPGEVLVDVACKADGIVSSRELERMTPAELAQLHVGDGVPVLVLNPEDRDGNIVVSISRAKGVHDWQWAEELLQSQEIFEGCVADCNKGGIIVNVGRLRGFVPASQIMPASGSERRSPADEQDEDRWAYMRGRQLKLKVIEVDRARNRLILSERLAVREWRQSAKQKLLDELQVGAVRRGVVTSLCEFGAFVDLGGADGLIHLSELSWERVDHPNEVLHEGQMVEVYVLDIDREKGRIGLSLRRLSPEPWEDIARTFAIGQVVEGTITKIVSFGAFARIGDNVEGLVHISELSEARINHPHEVVREGDVVPLKVIRVDSDKRRIGLSLRQAQGDVDFDWHAELEQSHEEDEADTH